jgi:thiamine biosynthesis lipoprotein
MTSEYDTTFLSMGSAVRMVIGAPLDASVPSPEEAARRERTFVEHCAAQLSRFNPDSELCALNDDPRAEVPASQLLRAAVAAGVWAAERSGGLVDPTLVGAIERAGYRDSRDGVVPVPLAEALAAAPRRRPALPHRDAAWRSIEVDDRAGVIRRPPGVRIDTGGSTKGLIADAVAHRLAGYARAAVDCGGDIAVRGSWEIEVQHPLTREHVHKLHVADGGVATSGLDVRIWRRADGSFAHHLLDPSTGRPAWTGLIGASAVAASALEAEALSKLALLSGPDGGRRALAGDGGALFHDDGRFELVKLAPRTLMRVEA